MNVPDLNIRCANKKHLLMEKKREILCYWSGSSTVKNHGSGNDFYDYILEVKNEGK